MLVAHGDVRKAQRVRMVKSESIPVVCDVGQATVHSAEAGGGELFQLVGALPQRLAAALPSAILVSGARPAPAPTPAPSPGASRSGLQEAAPCNWTLNAPCRVHVSRKRAVLAEPRRSGGVTRRAALPQCACGGRLLRRVCQGPPWVHATELQRSAANLFG
jgi:hypothetical protein